MQHDRRKTEAAPTSGLIERSVTSLKALEHLHGAESPELQRELEKLEAKLFAQLSRRFGLEDQAPRPSPKD